MEGHTGRSDDRTAGDRSRDSDRPSIELDAVVVRYENGADRCTVVPSDESEKRNLTAWFTADRSAFVDLEEMR